MRLLIHQFVKICAEGLPCPEPIVEFGSFQVPGLEIIANLRGFFSGKKYIGADMRQGPGVDMVLDLHNVDLPPESVGTVLMMDTLEHVEYPRKAIDEIYRILKPGGVLIMSSVLDFPIHEHPYDYWRFTPEAFRSLLKPFEASFVEYSGKDLFPHTIVGIGFKGPVQGKYPDSFTSKINEWKIVWTPKKQRGIKRFMKFLRRVRIKYRPR